MLNFEKELETLLAGEIGAAETDAFDMLVGEGQRLAKELGKKQDDLSLQIEEIYDIIKERDTKDEAVRTELGRVQQLQNAVVRMFDIIEDFLRFAAQSGNEELANQARMMWKNADRLLESCSIERIGTPGTPLDPRLHTVLAAAHSQYPYEHIADVVQSGYRYSGTLIRKASVVVSLAGESRIKNEESRTE